MERPSEASAFKASATCCYSFSLLWGRLAGWKLEGWSQASCESSWEREGLKLVRRIADWKLAGWMLASRDAGWLLAGWIEGWEIRFVRTRVTSVVYLGTFFVSVWSVNFFLGNYIWKTNIVLHYSFEVSRWIVFAKMLWWPYLKSMFEFLNEVRFIEF